MNETIAISRSASGLSSNGTARLLALLVPVGLLGGALFSQYVGGLWPCEMCWWQRYPHAAAIVIAGLAFAFAADSPPARILTALAAVAIAISGGIGVYHAGVEAHVFKGLTACAATGAGGSAANVLEQIMKVPLIQCDQVQWRFVGLSLAAWNAIISLSGGSAIALMLYRKRTT
ncbi:disulfide bond formation protein B [Sphingomonas sp.]|uniref:disulfide bond formation protein B n=1 Tax=Sphingomonas sp. TaxID=28214 RepID=UPI00286B039C|nr:disulfide bond formation protein B [Sphingomonas sp.]